MKHTVSVLVENKFGVLAHVSGLFSSRGFNIDSLTVGETEDPTVSRMTIVVHGDEKVLEQIMKQLNKLIDVIKVQDFTREETIDRELILVKLAVNPVSRTDIMQIVNTFRAKIVDVNPKTMIVEVTGNESKIDAMLELLRPYGVREVVRTGLISIARRGEMKAASGKASPESVEETVEEPKKKATAKVGKKGKK